MNTKTIYIASSGTSSTEMKEQIKKHFKWEYQIIDINERNPDHPNPAAEVSKHVLYNENSFGIVMCGNGFGVAKEASISDDITVINCVTLSQVRSGRRINNANILAIGARMVSIDVALDLVEAFLLDYK